MALSGLEHAPASVDELERVAQFLGDEAVDAVEMYRAGEVPEAGAREVLAAMILGVDPIQLQDLRPAVAEPSPGAVAPEQCSWEDLERVSALLDGKYVMDQEHLAGPADVEEQMDTIRDSVAALILGVHHSQAKALRMEAGDGPRVQVVGLDPYSPEPHVGHSVVEHPDTDRGELIFTEEMQGFCRLSVPCLGRGTTSGNDNALPTKFSIVPPMGGPVVSFLDLDGPLALAKLFRAYARACENLGKEVEEDGFGIFVERDFSA